MLLDELDSDYREEYNNRKKNSKENIFSTDIINSILSKSNSEDMEILFSINKKNISKEEKIFSEKINNLVQSINKFNEKNEKEKKEKSSTKKKKVIVEIKIKLIIHY